MLQDRGQPVRLKRKANLSNKRNLGLENDAEVGVLARGSSSQEVCEVRNTMMIQVSTENDRRKSCFLLWEMKRDLMFILSLLAFFFFGTH